MFAKNTINMKKLLFISLVSILFASKQSIHAQEIDTLLATKKFTIENCVNEFAADKTVETKVGYQYWFADKDFLDGRTLKMSVVEPHQATHAPHKHVEDEFFLHGGPVGSCTFGTSAQTCCMSRWLSPVSRGAGEFAQKRIP